MFEIFFIIAPMFLIIFGSAFLQRLKRFNHKYLFVLNQFALHIGFPILIFYSIINSRLNLTTQLDLILINSIFILFLFCLITLIAKMFCLDKKLIRTILIGLTFSNVAYLGIPILMKVYNQTIADHATIITSVYLFWIFSLGIWGLAQLTKRIETREELIKLVFLNPLLLAVFLGVFVKIFNLPIPPTIKQSLEMIASSITPLVLIVIGLFLGEFKIHNKKAWLLSLVLSLFSLLVIPFLFYLYVKLTNKNLEFWKPSIIQAAMPLAITPFALADQFNLKKDLIARWIVLSTILSIFTIPFWIAI